MNKNILLIGILIFVCIVIYLSFSNIEGFTPKNPNLKRNDIPTLIDDNITKLNDSLLISKYRLTYENSIEKLHEQIGLEILNQTLNNIEELTKNPSSTNSLKLISQINELEKFKSTLNETMEILDKN